MAKAVVYDHQKLVGAGLESILNKIQAVEVVGKYHNLSPLVLLLKSGVETDLILLSLSSSSREELEWIKTIGKTSASPILLITEDADPIMVKRAFKHGAKGCLDKSEDISVFEQAILHLLRGEQFLSSTIGLNSMSLWPTDGFENYTVSISNRESEILQLIAAGLTNQEIADKTFTSKRTVEGHRQNLINKTGSSNTAQLIVNAMKMRLLQ